MHTYIIAEISANHCGDINLAKKIIKKSKEIGADAVKIQTYTADTLTIDCKNDEFLINDKNSCYKENNSDKYTYKQQSSIKIYCVFSS